MTNKSDLAELGAHAAGAAAGVAAAKLSLRVVGLLNRARDASAVKNAQIAGALGITEGRVSQVFNGDGNVHIATVARFLAACGYELELVARPLVDGLPELRRVVRRSRTAAVSEAASRTWDFFEQVYASGSGVSSHVSAVPRPSGSVDCLEPMGLPKHLGAWPLVGAGGVGVKAPKRRVDHAFPSWDTAVEEAVKVEGEEAKQPVGTP